MQLKPLFTAASQYLAILAWALWIGGLAFYFGVVVPVGSTVIGGSEQGFVTQSTAAFSQAGVPIIDGSNEGGTTESRHAGWDGLIQRHAALILTDRAGELADYLKAQPPSPPPATHRLPIPSPPSSQL